MYLVLVVGGSVTVDLSCQSPNPLHPLHAPRSPLPSPLAPSHPSSSLSLLQLDASHLLTLNLDPTQSLGSEKYNDCDGQRATRYSCKINRCRMLPNLIVENNASFYPLVPGRAQSLRAGLCVFVSTSVRNMHMTRAIMSTHGIVKPHS